MKKHVIIFFFIFSFHLQLHATPYPPFTYLSIDQGLSNNSVRCIFQDHNGFMWFGTYDGLNRYDGYEFKVFRNKLGDSTSLPHNYIYAMSEDHHNNLWIGTGQGIGIYNNLTSKFLPAFYYPYQSNAKEKITANINVIKTDAEGNIFIGTNGWGLLVQMEGTGTANQLSIKRGAAETGGYNVQSILIDKQKHTWLFIRDMGLCVYDYANRKIQLMNDNVRSANCMVSDEEGNLWLGTNNGLYKYAVATNALLKLYNEASGNLTADNVACLSFDKQQHLWIGTEGGGINILDPATEKFDYLLPGENKNTLTSESVFAIYVDKESRKWMGTLKGGINIIDPQKSRFQTIAHDPLNSNSLVNNFVSSFYEDDDKNLWIGTDGGGLSNWNRKLNNFKNFRHEAGNVQSLSNNLVTSIKQDYLNNIWIATFGGGINKYNTSKNAFEHFKCFNDVTGEENKNVWLLFEDRDKSLWATTFARGKLYRFNPRLNRFEVFDQGLTDLIAINEDRDGVLWVGNSHQLVKIDKIHSKHIIYEIGKPIRAIYEDRNGNFWIGTEGGGLILFDRLQGKISSRFSVSDGLCNNSVLNIVEDNQGNLWLSTFNGLSKFNAGIKVFKNFYQSDGLQSNQFLYNAALRLRSGELVFGGIKGFNIFYPDSIKPQNNILPVLLTGLRISNTPVTAEDEYVAKTSSDKIESLKIPYNKAVLSFDFAALEYSAPGKIMYAYYLKGWDKGWNYTGNLRTANYTHLNEGSYTFKIKSTNTEGMWNDQETRLNIIVLPPWYRSWWAYLLYMSIAGVLIYFYKLHKARQARLKYKIRIAQLNADKEKELNEKKLSFFTNVSHEFRTPLTLIINPIKELLYNKAKDTNVDLNIVYRNARRLLSLVDQLLLFRKAERDADLLNVVRLNFTDLCKEVYLCFIHQAQTKKIKYDLRYDHEAIEIYADREKMEIVLFNLISNALKFTPAGGQILFSIQETEKEVEIRIVDTGSGIPETTGDKLFELFYQVKQGPGSKSGFGIGLYLVKHFIDSHKGKISYESNPGQGTTFLVQLQKGKEHFGPGYPISEEESESSVFLKELVEEASPENAEVENIPAEEESMDIVEAEDQSILVIDDNEQIRQYLKQIFANGFKMYEADNGNEGLKLAQQYAPSLIISDVVMHGMSGIEMCNIIKQDPDLRHIPVILLTGTSSAEVKLKGIECGADDYITKPFEKELLVARVTNILKSRNNLQTYFYNEITLRKNDLKISPEYKAFLERCIQIVEKNLENENFSIKTLAMEIGMSHSNLYKKVKSISGQSVNSFIRFIRLRKAAELFINTENNVNETAFQVGIGDIKYFRKHFFKLFGMNPSEYIKKYRKAFTKEYNLNEKAVNKDQ